MQIPRWYIRFLRIDWLVIEKRIKQIWPLVKCVCTISAENRHTLIVGSPGTGKRQYPARLKILNFAWLKSQAVEGIKYEKTYLLFRVSCL